MKTVVYSDAAAKALDDLPDRARRQVIDGIELYAMTGRGDVVPMQGRLGHRLRIGRYRVIFAEDARTVLAISIAKRDSQTYR